MARSDTHLLRPRFIFAGRNTFVYPANGTGYDLLQPGAMIWIDDWVENITGYCWKELLNNYDVMAAAYWKRMQRSNIPVNDDVLYGLIEEVPYLVHESELGYEGQAALAENPVPILSRSFEQKIPETAILEQVA